MSIYLEDNPPARSQWRSPRRAEVTGAIVVHTAESQTDVSPPDSGAENVASFISRRSDPGSYHSIVDSDTTVHLGRYLWEMFGEGTGGNRWALHLSFACQAHQWPTLPISWVQGAIEQGAREAAAMAHWVHAETGVVVPPRTITRDEYRAGKPGFIAHGTVDPGRRSDPGAQFPWDVFLDRYSELLDAGLQIDGGDNNADVILPGNRDGTIRRMQRALTDAGYYTGRIDGDPYLETAGGLDAAMQRLADLETAFVAFSQVLRAMSEND